ncbi:hypothetical protein GCM10011367_13780 [Marinicauda pacifica]|uniref:DUF2975 domain-containing protein n=1 Tax=Marinicauda pacifica TaxID=1133559 RepID=A0A4S2HA63_9PROT|nr:hypothetical protein [Marinicauda pacifica]TGY92807.1 hypothetical protein E5162_06960 [Marinicauda pacifica]GGE40520.1 hypothetical protein GCM10011367_13780 [Marinicauda pacifica]
MKAMDKRHAAASESPEQGLTPAMQGWAAVFAVLTRLGAAFVIVFAVLPVAIFPEMLPERATYMGERYDWYAWPLRLGAAAIVLVPSSIMAWGLRGLGRFFGQCAGDHPFAVSGLTGLRNFALAIWLNAVLGPLAGAGLSAYLSGLSPEVSGQLALSVGSGDLGALLLGASFFFAAQLLHEGGRAHDELRTIL